MIEDQTWPKRCGHTRVKSGVSRGEAVARIRAAVDARDEVSIYIAWEGGKGGRDKGRALISGWRQALQQAHDSVSSMCVGLAQCVYVCGPCPCPQGSGIVIVARTDAAAAVSLEEALWRAAAFADAGAAGPPRGRACLFCVCVVFAWGRIALGVT